MGPVGFELGLRVPVHGVVPLDVNNMLQLCDSFMGWHPLVFTLRGRNNSMLPSLRASIEPLYFRSGEAFQTTVKPSACAQ